jgi:hypothetical protein
MKDARLELLPVTRQMASACIRDMNLKDRIGLHLNCQRELITLGAENAFTARITRLSTAVHRT